MNLPPPVRLTLRDNVVALMRHAYGRENKTRLGQETGISVGGAQRILAAETSVGLDVLERVARRFKLQVWQLLVPGLAPGTPPTLASAVAQPIDTYAARNILEGQLVTFFRGLNPEHRDDLLALANRWYVADTQPGPSVADPFPSAPRLANKKP